jgi:hypothetical protein
MTPTLRDPKTVMVEIATADAPDTYLRSALIAAQLGGQAKSSPRPALGLSCSPLIRTL